MFRQSLEHEAVCAGSPREVPALMLQPCGISSCWVLGGWQTFRAYPSSEIASLAHTKLVPLGN